MYNLKIHKESDFRSMLSVVIFLLLTVCLLVFGAGPTWAEDEQGEYPDQAGREALRLWSERERDRSMAEASRRYWDYWLSRPSRQYSAHRLWLKLDQIQKWLKDPEHNPPPPPPPLPPRHWIPPYYPPYPYAYPYSYNYSYPYSSYYPPPYYRAPPMGPPPPYYPYPGVPEKPKD